MARITSTLSADNLGASSVGRPCVATPRGVRPSRPELTHVQFTTVSCWLGTAPIAATRRGVCAVELGDDAPAVKTEFRQRFPGVTDCHLVPEFDNWAARVERALAQAALGGELSADTDVPLDWHGTPFQQRVWRTLRCIPHGATWTYAELARQIGQPRAVRAVATACAANPLAVLVPCHRVVRQDGQLAGYRWGLDRKRQLLGSEVR